MEINELTAPAIVASAGIFIANQIWTFVSKERKQLIEALQQNTLALHRLEIKLELLEKKIEAIPEIQKDVDGLGKKLRDMSIS